MWNYLFEINGEYDEHCGEMFFVQCDTKAEAREIAKENFPEENVHFLGKYTDEEAEWYGYDTY